MSSNLNSRYSHVLWLAGDLLQPLSFQHSLNGQYQICDYGDRASLSFFMVPSSAHAISVQVGCDSTDNQIKFFGSMGYQNF